MEHAIFISNRRAQEFGMLCMGSNTRVIGCETVPHKRRGALIGFKVRLRYHDHTEFVTEGML